MSPDERHKIFMDGFEKGKEHKRPSTTTLEIMDELMKKLETKADKDDIKDLYGKFEHRFEQMDKHVSKKANKTDLETFRKERRQTIMWAIGLAITVILASATFFWSQIDNKADKADVDLIRTDIQNLSEDVKDVLRDSQATANEVSELKGQLKQLQLID